MANKYEHEIPEGYEARIEGNKVVIEKVNERIRKELVEKIINLACSGFISQEQKQTFIAYLEKQKEQKPDSLIYDKDLDKAAREFYLSGGADSPVDSTGLVPIVRMAEFGATWMKERMEKEQKPTEYNEYKMLIEGARENGKIEGRKEVIEHPDKYGLTKQKSLKWSEEDEEMYARVVRRYTDYEGVIMRTKEESVAAKMLDAMAQEEIWLKSLRPSWKPSEEQMIAFDGCLKHWSGNKSQKEILESLYEQLKKLM